MPASIIINQVAKPAGVAGKFRTDLDAGAIVTCSNATIESSYLWTLEDVPIRSTLARGTTGNLNTFSFTPDVKGTYRVSLTVNASPFPADHAVLGAAVRSYGAKSLGWRYLAADEEDEDNENKSPALNFPGNVNTRGWATEIDLQMEQAELAAYEVANAVVTSPGPGADNFVHLDPVTGLLDPSILPTAGGIYINVKAAPYLAAGDGVTDDALKIQAALTAASASQYGAVVFFPAGDYLIGSTLTLVPANPDFGRITLLGTGTTSTKLILPNAAIGLDIGDGITYRRYLQFNNLTFSRAAVGTNYLIRSRRINQFKFINCGFAGGEESLYLSEAQIGEVRDCWFGDNVVDAYIHLVNSVDVSITGNYFERTPQVGDGQHIHLGPGCDSCTIVGNRFTTGVIAVENAGGASDYVTVAGNNISGCDNGVRVVGGTGWSITGNVIVGTGAGGSIGIEIDTAPDCSVVSNAVSGFVDSIQDSGYLGTRLVGNAVDVAADVSLIQTVVNAATLSALRLVGANLDYNVPTNITDITDGHEGQVFTLIWVALNATVEVTGNIDLLGGAAFTGAIGDTLVLQYDGTNWKEISRSSVGAVAPTLQTAYDAGNTITIDATGAVVINNALAGVTNTLELSRTVGTGAALSIAGPTTTTGNITKTGDATFTLTSNKAAGGTSAFVLTTNAIDFAAGDPVLQINDTATLVQVFGDGHVTAAGYYQGGNGSAGTPTYGFSSDLSNGFYLYGADSIGVTAGGTVRSTFSPAGLAQYSAVTMAPVGEPAASVAGADSQSITFMGYTVGPAQRNFTVLNEADAGTDTYRLRFNRNDTTAMMSIDEVGKLTVYNYAAINTTEYRQGYINALLAGVAAYSLITTTATLAIDAVTSLTTTAVGATGPEFKFSHAKAQVGSVGDAVGNVSFYGPDNNGAFNSTHYADVRGVINSPADTAESGRIEFHAITGGTFGRFLRIRGGNVAAEQGAIFQSDIAAGLGVAAFGFDAGNDFATAQPVFYIRDNVNAAAATLFSVDGVGAASIGGAGLATAPAIIRTGDTNTGFYWSSDDEMSVALAGVQAFKWAVGSATLFYANDGTTGPLLELRHTRTNGGNPNDEAGTIDFYTDDAAAGGVATRFGQIQCLATSVTDTIEYGAFDLKVINNGTFAAVLRVLGDGANGAVISNAKAAAATPALRFRATSSFSASQPIVYFENADGAILPFQFFGQGDIIATSTTDVAASAPVLDLYHNRATFTDGDTAGIVRFSAVGSGPAKFTAAEIRGIAADVDPFASVDGRLDFYTMGAGTLRNAFSVYSTDGVTAWIGVGTSPVFTMESASPSVTIPYLIITQRIQSATSLIMMGDSGASSPTFTIAASGLFTTAYSNNGAVGPTLELRHTRSDNGATDDEAGKILFFTDDNGGAATEFANIKVSAQSAAAGTEGGRFSFNIMSGGALDELLLIEPDLVSIQTAGAATAQFGVGSWGHKWHANYPSSSANRTTAAFKSTLTTAEVMWSKTLTDGRAYVIEATVVGRKNGSVRGMYHKAIGCYRDGGGAVSVGTSTFYDIETDGTWDCYFGVSGNDVQLLVHGNNSGAETVYWVAEITFQSVSDDSAGTGFDI